MDGTNAETTALCASINPTAADFKRVYAWLFWHAPRRYLIAILGATLWLIAGEAWLRGDIPTAVAEGALVAGYLLVALVQWSFILPGRAWRSAAGHFPLHAEFRPEGLVLTGPTSHVQSRWQSFDRYIDGRDFILLVHPDKTFFMVPKRDVECSRLNDLGAFLAARLPRKTSLPI
ncbi:MAG TPA: YcxB family protein [Candidatus Acidoferrales bacterium]|nr:YcxB family protein [Candidatus Acidoferrales bacterium]